MASRRRVDGVEDDAMIQDERAVNLIPTQLLTDLRIGLNAARASSAAAFHLRSDTFVAFVVAARQRSSAFRETDCCPMMTMMP